jgi:hypothetical protein
LNFLRGKEAGEEEITVTIELLDLGLGKLHGSLLVCCLYAVYSIL